MELSSYQNDWDEYGRNRNEIICVIWGTMDEKMSKPVRYIYLLCLTWKISHFFLKVFRPMKKSEWNIKIYVSNTINIYFYPKESTCKGLLTIFTPVTNKFK